MKITLGRRYFDEVDRTSPEEVREALERAEADPPKDPAVLRLIAEEDEADAYP